MEAALPRMRLIAFSKVLFSNQPPKYNNKILCDEYLWNYQPSSSSTEFSLSISIVKKYAFLCVSNKLLYFCKRKELFDKQT